MKRFALIGAALWLGVSVGDASAFESFSENYPPVEAPIVRVAKPVPRKPAVRTKGKAKHIHIIASRGLIGRVFSTGMDELVAKGVQRGMTGTVYDWPFASSMAAEAITRTNAGETVVLVGHSLGALAAVNAATKLGHLGYRVKLVVTYDPTPAVRPIPANVRVAVNFYQRIGLIGRGRTAPGRGFKGRLINEQVHLTHTDLDNDARLHRQTFNWIGRI